MLEPPPIPITTITVTVRYILAVPIWSPVITPVPSTVFIVGAYDDERWRRRRRFQVKRASTRRRRAKLGHAETAMTSFTVVSVVTGGGMTSRLTQLPGPGLHEAFIKPRPIHTYAHTHIHFDVFTPRRSSRSQSSL